MLKGGVLIYKSFTNIDLSLYRNIPLGVDSACGIQNGFIIARSDHQFRLRANHGVCIRNGINMLPFFLDRILGVIGKNCTVVAFEILKGQFRLEDIDVGIAFVGLCRCRCTLSGQTIRLGRYRNLDGVSNILRHVLQVSSWDCIAILVLDGYGDINMFHLPLLQAVGFVGVVCLGQVKGNTANRNSCAVFKLIGSHIIQQIYVLVLCLHAYIPDGNIDPGFREYELRLCIRSVLIYACQIIGGNIIAAKEVRLAFYLKGDLQFVATVAHFAVFRYRTAPVFGEVKAFNGYFAVLSDCGSHAGRSSNTPGILITILARAGIGFQGDISCCCTVMQPEVGGDKVLHNRFCSQGRSSAALLNLIGNLLKDTIQRLCIRSGKIIAGMLHASIIAGKMLHEPVSGIRYPSISLIQVSGGFCSITAGICALKDTDGIHGCPTGLNRICFCDCALGDTFLESATSCRRTIGKDNDNTIAVLAFLNGIVIQDLLCHVHTQIYFGGAVCSQCADCRIDHVLSGSCIHALKNIPIILLGNIAVGHTNGATVTSAD